VSGNGILSIILFRIKHLPHRSAGMFPDKADTTYLPSGRREDVFVPLIVASFNNFACVRLVFLLRGISQQTNIIVNIKVEQRA
jgi:hypothetical protein